MTSNSDKRFIRVTLIGVILIAVILITGTYWTGRSASRDTVAAVRSVSLFYLDELAGRREQVVSSNLRQSIANIQIANEPPMFPGELSSLDVLMQYQLRVRQLYGLEKFAYVDEDGLIYTSQGTQDNFDEYHFPLDLQEPVISIKDLDSTEKKVIIAVPVRHTLFNGKTLKVCFMEIAMDNMLSGVSMRSSDANTTFCNIYTDTGVALSNVVLGGLSSENNLLTALGSAVFENGYSFAQVRDDFAAHRRGVVSFTYNGISETLSYVPIAGTDWLLTYLIRESVISDRISSVSNGIVMRSLLESALIAVVLFIMFLVLFRQTRKAARLELDKETAEAASRAKREELEQRLALQEQLLQEQKNREEQDRMITALASDYRSVYYVDLDADEGICYRSDPRYNTYSPGDHFAFSQAIADYAEKYVAKQHRERFRAFVDPVNIRAGLEKELIVTCRYLSVRDGEERYEMLRMAGVRHAEDRTDHIVHAVGLGFTDIDQEMRETLSRSLALGDALAAAEEANKAKTAFLSNMSHEIRTPMNAIIGLDSIALNDPTISPQTRGYLEKIGDSAHHLLGLINDILDMSRIESGRITLRQEEFSFSGLLEQVNTMFSSQCQDKHLNYHCELRGQIDDYYIGDSTKLREVLINILSNAVKFTPEGGEVSLTLERAAQFDDKSTLRFIIRDTGIGISKEFLPHIFDTFSQEDSSTTNKYGSSGLGMAITKSIVEMMNGSIQVESEKGAGTTFTVTVTLTDSHRQLTPDDGAEIQLQGMSVLVVDDDPIACEHARLVLEKAGVACETASSGAEAVDMVRLRHARRKPYNLILIDWKMPEMDGVTTARLIRTDIGDESAIIILTAYHWDDVLEEATAAGVDSFISKPLFISSVMEEFSSALKRKKTQRPAAPAVQLAGRRVLLAEDVDVNAEIMLMVLEMRGIQAERAENGRIAVEKFTASAPGYYDAILMDLRMPKMDGLEATTRIRALDRPDAKAIPIIALTANAFDEDVQRSLQAGLNAHLSKPVDPDTLFKTLEGLIAP